MVLCPHSQLYNSLFLQYHIRDSRTDKDKAQIIFVNNWKKSFDRQRRNMVETEVVLAMWINLNGATGGEREGMAKET